MRGTGARPIVPCALACALLLVFAACDSSQREAPPAAPEAPAADENLDLLIPSLVDAIQAKQPNFVLEHVAQAFKEDGGLDFYDVRALVEKYAFVEDAVGARLESVQVTPQSDGRQLVSARVAFTLGQRLAAGESLPKDSVVYAIDVVFARSEGRWQAVGGRYKRESPPPVTSPPMASIATRCPGRACSTLR
jgi:hypothetical protein